MGDRNTTLLLGRAMGAVLGGLLSLLASGCASMQSSMKEHFQQPPSTLNADHATTGLVVLDFGLGPEGGLPETVQGAHIQGTGTDGADLYAPRLEVAFEPFGVLFQGVAPGRYRVTKLLSYGYSGKTPEIRSWAVTDTSSEFEVRAGELSYVGPFWATTHGRSASLSWRPRPGRERTVWRAVERKYPSSPWEPAIRRRVESIETLATEADTSLGSPESRRRSLDYPDPPKTFEHIVMSEKLGDFSKRAGPVGLGGTLIVSPDGIQYDGSRTLTLATPQLRAVSREGQWVKLEYDQDDGPRTVWLGFGFYNDSEITDQIELSIASLLQVKR